MTACLCMFTDCFVNYGAIWKLKMFFQSFSLNLKYFFLSSVFKIIHWLVKSVFIYSHSNSQSVIALHIALYVIGSMPKDNKLYVLNIDVKCSLSLKVYG